MASQQQPDHWSSKAYKTSASFVPKLTTTLLSYLSPSPSDRILDIGCGDGLLTAKIAGLVPHGLVLGLDASQSMIDSATRDFGPEKTPNCAFRRVDCTMIAEDGSLDVVDGTWDKVFSNAALHWILRQPDTRIKVFRDIHASLKLGGTFVFEMGGAGNVAEVHSAMIAALVAHGVPLAEAQEACPWFFPSETWMRQTLERTGFEVLKLESEYRPTQLTTREGGGLDGWVHLMGAQFLEHVDEAQRDDVVGWVVGVLRSVIRREEDGSWWIGYVRLRAVARKGVD